MLMTKLLLLLLFVIVEVVLFCIFICVLNNKINKKQATERNTEIGFVEQKLSPCTIKNLYYEFLIDTFLRENFPEMERWESVYADDVYSHFNGRHHVMVYFPGNRKLRIQFTVDCKNPLECMKIYKEPENKPAEKLEEWWAKWWPAIFEKVTREGKLLIKSDELPKNKDILDAVLSKLESTGEYFLSQSEEGLTIIPA